MPSFNTHHAYLYNVPHHAEDHWVSFWVQCPPLMNAPLCPLQGIILIQIWRGNKCKLTVVRAIERTWHNLAWRWRALVSVVVSFRYTWAPLVPAWPACRRASRAFLTPGARDPNQISSFVPTSCLFDTRVGAQSNRNSIDNDSSWWLQWNYFQPRKLWCKKRFRYV